LTCDRINCKGQKGDVNEEKTNSNSWTNRNLFAAGWDHLRFIFEPKHCPAPDINAASPGLGKFTFPV
jgi:hypothetical protein